MAESTPTSPSEDLAHKKGGRQVAILGALRPQPASPAASGLATLAHEEWGELCADLERWLDEEPQGSR